MPQRPLVDVLDRLVESGWAACFAAAGAAELAADALAPMRPGRRPVVLLRPTGGRRVLCIATHPDDETVGCGGALARHAMVGDVVHVAVVTDGSGSRAGGLGPDEMARVRRDEVSAACAALGVDTLHGPWVAEDRLTVTGAVDVLRPVIANFQPDITYVPSCVDFHPGHLVVAQAVAELLPVGTLARAYAVQVPLTRTLTDAVLTVGHARPRLAAALAAHRSQHATLRTALRLRRYVAARHRQGDLAEAFWCMSAQSYRRLHSPQQLALASDAFRGLRHRSFGDVLAYFTGAARRRELALLCRT